MTKMFGISFNMGSSMAGMQKMVNAELTAAKQENASAKASVGKDTVQSSTSTPTGTSGSSTTLSLTDMYKQNLALEQSYLHNSRAELEKPSSSNLNYSA
jgi:hypothetical protein